MEEILNQNIFEDIIVFVYSFRLISNMSVNLDLVKFGRRILGQSVVAALKTVKDVVLRTWDQPKILSFSFY